MDSTLLQGIALLETRDGEKSIKGPNGEDSNNLFNIKDFSGQGYRAFDKAEGSRDAYRVYPDREASIQDFVGLLQRKYPKAHDALIAGDASGFAKALKAGGYATDPNYETKLVSTINSVRSKAQAEPAESGAKRAVQQSVLEGESAYGQLQQLRKSGWGPDIDEALKQGWTPEDIVKRIAGAEVDEAKTAKAKVEQQGVLSRVAEGAGNTLSDAALAARQIVANGDQEKALQAEAAARRDDLGRRALSATTSGAVGEAVPGIALGAGAAIATGGTSLVPLVAGQAVSGAAREALRPTVDGESRTKNALAGALTDAALVGAPLVAGKVASKALGASLGRSPELVAERTALASRIEAEGLPVNAATLTDYGKNIAARMPDAGDVRAFRDSADGVITKKVAEGLGVNSYAGSIDTELLNLARPSIKTALDDATNLTLTVPQSLKADVQAIVAGSNNPLTKGVSDMAAIKGYAKNIIAAADSGAAVSGRQLQELASQLKAIAASHTAEAGERQVAAELVGKLNSTLKAAMTPEQALKFAEANRQYANLKAVEKMVALSNDTGAVSPRQMLQAVKTGRFKNAFLKDEAPYQELGKTAAEALGPANGRGLGDILGRAVGTGDGVLGAASVIEPTTGLTALAGKKLAEKLLAKAITSENPTLVRLLTGVGGKGSKGVDPAVKRYLAAALGGATAGVSQ